MEKNESASRSRILQAALKRFANAGYAGVSVQQIVGEAKVTKPTLYYYFRSKAGLYQALVNRAHGERFHVMQNAGKGESFPVKLTKILIAMFQFLHKNRDLLRLAYASAFAAPGEIPGQHDFYKKGFTHFLFLQDLIQKEINDGRLITPFTSQELAMGFYGLMNIYLMGALINPGLKALNHRSAQKVVRLYLRGAQAVHKRAGSKASMSDEMIDTQ